MAGGTLDSSREHNEPQLVRLIQVGTPDEANAAFGLLYEANDPSLRRFLAYTKGLQESEIDEVCATVWDRALGHITKYVPKGIPYLAWLRRTAVYVTHERYRFHKQQRRRTRPMTDDFDVEGQATWMYPLLSLLEAEDEEETMRRRQDVREALAQLLVELPPDYRDVIEALHEMELSSKEAAELLGWKQRKVYDTYYRATNRLKALLLERYGITEGSFDGREYLPLNS